MSNQMLNNGDTGLQIRTKINEMFTELYDQGIMINSDHVFADNTARDAYFTANPTEKTDGVLISVGIGFQQWDADTTAWIDKTAIISGDAISFVDSASINFTYDPETGNLTGAVIDNSSTQKVQLLNNGTLIGTRKSVNLIPGTNVTMTIADDVANDRVNVTVNASGGGGGALYPAIPVGSAVKSGNIEAVISSIDYTTDVISCATSDLSGVSVGMRVYTTLNTDVSNTYLPNVLPYGFGHSTRNYVIAVDPVAKTMQVSAAAGGASIDFTVNANVDFTKFHMEVTPNTAADSLEVTGLSPKKRYRAVYVGKIAASQSVFLSPTTWIDESTWSTSASWGRIPGTYDGTVGAFGEATFWTDESGSYATSRSIVVKHNNATGHTKTDTIVNGLSFAHNDTAFTAIKVQVNNDKFMNGSKLLVYEATD